MSTTLLGRKNDYVDADTIAAAELNAVANDLEWIAGGYAALDVAGASDVTLSESQYERNVLDLTGTLTGNINVVLPGHAGRRWIVHNGTSGSFTLTAKTSGGSGVAISQGFAALVACNGTDIVRRGPDVSTGGAVVVTSPRIVTAVVDANGNELFKLTATGSAVNELTVANAATGSSPSLTATGDDTNIPVTLAGKGTGAVRLGQATATDVRLLADQPLADSSGNELVKFSKASSAVNEVTVGNAATGARPTLAASGGDTNISLELQGKGTGGIAIGSGGTPITKSLSAATTWDPGSIADGDDLSTTITVTGAAVGDPCFASLSTLGTNDVLISAHVQAADTVRVVLLNRSGSSLDPASGTLRAVVFKY